QGGLLFVLSLVFAFLGVFFKWASCQCCMGWEVFYLRGFLLSAFFVYLRPTLHPQTRTFSVSVSLA
ncbi:MAG: hypothetical protein EBY24_20625, partial [Betaproteobacteria bacterium]|nr:hypothetical protein [Betaproteobacteria bacterium]